MEDNRPTLNAIMAKAGVSPPLPFGDFVRVNLPYKEEVNGELRFHNTGGTFRDYQIVGLNSWLRDEWFGLWDDPGAGKTAVAQAGICFWASQGTKTLVLTLSHLIGQFIDDFRETFDGIEKYLRIQAFDLPKKKREELEAQWEADPRGWPEVLVMTYEGFVNLSKLKSPDGNPKWFYDRGYNCMVPDEVHKRLSNPDTMLWKRVKAWRDNNQEHPLKPPANVTAFMPMTGTPIQRTLTDSYGIIELVNPGQYVSFAHFERLHCQYKKIKLSPENYIKTKGGKEIRQIRQLVGYRNHDIVNKHLFAHGRRVVKDQVMSLKEPNVRRLKLTLSDEHYQLYSKLTRERFLEMGDEVILAMSQQQLRQHALLLVSCPEAYMAPEDLQGFRNVVHEAVFQWLEDADLTQQKVILFFNRVESIRRYGKILGDHNPAFLYGETTNKDRERKKFLFDDDCRLLIANPSSAGAGLNAQKVSHNVLFVEPTGVFGDFKQGLERVLRSGQEHVVDCGIIHALRTVAPKAIQNMLNAEMDIERTLVDRSRLLAELRGEC